MPKKKPRVLTPSEHWLSIAESFIRSPQAIVEGAEPFDWQRDYPRAGVYFLVHGDRIQYVGISRDIDRRLRKHHDSWRFDKCLVIDGMPIDFLEDLEEFYIAWLRPQANGRRRYTSMKPHLERAIAGEFGESERWLLRWDDICVVAPPSGDSDLPRIGCKIDCRVLGWN